MLLQDLNIVSHLIVIDKTTLKVDTVTLNNTKIDIFNQLNNKI